MTGKEYRRALEVHLGHRREKPDDDSRWRVNYGSYEQVDIDEIARATKKIVKRWKRRLACKWNADTLRGALLDWAARRNQLPPTVACISAYRRRGRPMNHRFNIILDRAGELWVLEPIGVLAKGRKKVNPREKWLWPVHPKDGRFFDLNT